MTKIIISLFVFLSVSTFAAEKSTDNKFPVKCEVSDYFQQFGGQYQSSQTVTVQSIGIRYYAFSKKGEIITPVLKIDKYGPRPYRNSNAGILRDQTELEADYANKILELRDKGICE